MSVEKRLSQVFSASEEFTIDKNSKMIIMSDCHRSNGSWADNFANNQNLYFAALTYYYQEGFTYIELGDGDELWGNRSMEPIVTVHDHVFWLLSLFHQKKRLHMLFGNHDAVKKNAKPAVLGASLPNVVYREGLILKDISSGMKLFLVHGHQGDLLNDRLWRLARFLVRYLWNPLELIGVRDPTSAAKNYSKKNIVESKMIDWVKKYQQPIIAGHTHRPVFAKPGEALYFNDGSCVHPRCITAIEIEKGTISLVKWCLKTNPDRTLFVGREVLEGPVELTEYQKML